MFDASLSVMKIKQEVSVTDVMSSQMKEMCMNCSHMISTVAVGIM